MQILAGLKIAQGKKIQKKILGFRQEFKDAADEIKLHTSLADKKRRLAYNIPLSA